jgi:hypothetical protein
LSIPKIISKKVNVSNATHTSMFKKSSIFYFIL